MHPVHADNLLCLCKDGWFEIYITLFICLQDSFLKFGADALGRRDPVKQKEALRTLSQAGIVIGAFAVAAFAIKQIFS